MYPYNRCTETLCADLNAGPYSKHMHNTIILSNTNQDATDEAECARIASSIRFLIGDDDGLPGDVGCVDGFGSDVASTNCALTPEFGMSEAITVSVKR